MLTAAALIGFTSCDKEDGNGSSGGGSSSVLGTWKSTSAGYTSYEDNVQYDSQVSAEEYTLILKTDGTFRMNGKYGLIDEGTYTKTGSTLMANGIFEKIEYTIKSISGTKLSIENTEISIQGGKEFKDVYYYHFDKE